MRLTAVGIVALLLSACARPVLLTQQAPATLSQEPPGYELASVTRVVDGDTIEVTITRRVEGPGAGGAQIGHGYDVRLLGIDTPEAVDPYGRLLRYVYVGEEMADARLVVNGYARAYPYPPNVRHAVLLEALMHHARASDRGLWDEG